ncbi:hypothetical protein D3C80_1707640 [compost metagenome]
MRAIATGLELGDHLRGAAGAVGDDLGTGLGFKGRGNVAQRGKPGVIGPGQQAQGLALETGIAGAGANERHAHGRRGNRGDTYGLDELSSVQIMLAHGGLPLLL